MRKILVIGTSGAGKTTLAKRLAELLHIQFFPSDGFYWEVGWKLAPIEKAHQQVRNVLSQAEWVLDGNFDDEHDFVWSQADCIIWLDYAFFMVMTQVVTRNFRWWLTRETTWAGNKMTLRRVISGIRHAVKSYALKKKTYPPWLAGLSGVAIYRFRTRQETERWLQGLNCSPYK